jgi:hypothetical protein
MVVTLTAGSAAAEPCTRVRVLADPSLSARWHEAGAELAATVARLSEAECVDATLELSAHPRGTRLDVRSSDGRTATRIVTEPAALGAVAYGVLASIPPPETEPPALEPRPPPPTPPSPRDDASSTAAPPAREQPRPLSESRDPATTPATLGATFGTRIGAPTGIVSTEIELRGDVRLGHSLVSLSGRVGPTGSRLRANEDTDQQQTDVSVGALGGRWFSIGGGVLSLTGGPRVGMTIEATDTQSRSRRDWWLQAAARYIAPFGDRWRPAVALEVEAAPMRLWAGEGPGPMAFPSWSAAFRFGVVGGVP